MSRFVMALTYKPKVLAVRNGDCRQTIRKVGKRTIEPSDVITFHGWQDKPRRSPWSWDKKVVVFEVIPAKLSKDGMFIEGNLHAWASWYPTRLAEYDYIDPPTGEALRDVLFGLNGVPEQPVDYIIIRW